MATMALLLPLAARAQDAPKLVIDEDCEAFDISGDNSIVYAVSRLKRVKKLVIPRDDISIATGPGKTRKIVEADKFMPIPPPTGYMVNALAWSPDRQHIAADLTLEQPPPGYEEQVARDKKKQDDTERDAQEDRSLASVGGTKVVALLDGEGREIKVAGSKTRFIENAAHGTWLANGSVVYLTAGGPYAITLVRPSDGQTTGLFQGHTFDAVIWDAPHNRAFAVGSNLSLRGQLTLVQLDLIHESVTEIAKLENYKGSLSLSPSGTKVGFFEDGDTIEVIDIANPSKRLRVRAGFGRFEWSRDERRVLLKRGPEERSNDLVWVGLYDDSFLPALHDLSFRDFHITPDLESVAVTVPGKRVLKVYPLQ
jgi:hypothetical protein